MTVGGKVLVTGAGGFIGGWLVETLYLSGSTDVRAGIHTWTGAARPARFPLEIVLCDIMDRDQLEKAVSGMDCVIHCAKGSSESIVQGTRNVLEAALRHRVGRLVYISTTEVYGNSTGTIDETAPCPITGDPYGDRKIEAESLCWEYHARGLPLVVIRPPIVYGPFSKTWTVNIAFKLLSGNWGVFGEQGEGTCNLIYIADLVAGILVAARHERAVGEVFNLNGPEALTWNQYFERFNAAMCLEPLKVIAPGQATRQVLYRYTLPYSGGRLDLQRSLPYPAANVNALVADQGEKVTSEGLDNQGIRQTQNGNYYNLSSQNLPANQPILIRLSGLPSAAAAETTPGAASTSRILLYALAGVAIAGAILLALWPVLRRRARAGAVAEEAADREGLIDALAALDIAHRDGQLSETAYRDQRLRLKARLLDLMREEQGQ